MFVGKVIVTDFTGKYILGEHETEPCKSVKAAVHEAELLGSAVETKYPWSQQQEICVITYNKADYQTLSAKNV